MVGELGGGRREVRGGRWEVGRLEGLKAGGMVYGDGVGETQSHLVQRGLSFLFFSYLEEAPSSQAFAVTS